MHPLGQHQRQDDWTDMEWQLRNWWHFRWLSGDHIVEQACYSIDKINWAMGNRPPVKANALGGRLLRSGAESGNVYDHFTVIYDYADGARCFHTCRQMHHCAYDNTDYILGTEGKRKALAHAVKEFSALFLALGLYFGAAVGVLYGVEGMQPVDALYFAAATAST